MSKIVYQCDASGVFVSETTAQESPLEPGKYLIPGGCVEVVPPTIPTGSRAVWMTDSNEWRIEVTPVEAAAPAQTAEELAAQQWAAYQASATTAYTASTDIILRCYENSVAVPTDWVAYRKDLRTIIDATAQGDPMQPLPTRPADPVGI